MRYKIYGEDGATLQLFGPDYEGDIDLCVVDEDGDIKETILRFCSDGTIEILNPIQTEGFKVDSSGNIVIEEHL